MKDKNGIDIVRKIPIETKKGLIFTSKDNKVWYIKYPDVEHGFSQFGSVTSEKLCEFFTAMSNGKTLDEARGLVFGEQFLLKNINKTLKSQGFNI